MAVDIVDLRDLSNLEKSTVAYLAALEAAEPALERLEAAKCPGAGHVGYCLGEVAERLQHLAEALEDVRLSDGEQAVWDFRFYKVRLGLSVEGAARELLDSGAEGLNRIEPMRRYAATVA